MWMDEIEKPLINGWLIAACLIGQLIILYISFDAYMAISPFCTVATDGLRILFGLLHLSLFAVFVLGSLALVLPNLRRFYLVFLGLGLIALSVQAVLVQNGQLTCDAL